MSRDSNATYLHMHFSNHADIFEDFTNPSTAKIVPEDIRVPLHLQPINPEDEDDVVPDQHAAFGIQRATQAKKEVMWKDFGLEDLSRRGPGEGAVGLGGVGYVGPKVAGLKGPAPVKRDEPVGLALRRRPGAGGQALGMASGGTESQAGGNSGNGLR